MLIDKKNSKDLVIPFTRCDDSKSIKILSLHYHELIGKIKEHERKILQILDSWWFYARKVLDMIKEIIGIRIFDNIKILIVTDDKLIGNIKDDNVFIHNYF